MQTERENGDGRFGWKTKSNKGTRKKKEKKEKEKEKKEEEKEKEKRKRKNLVIQSTYPRGSCGQKSPFSEAWPSQTFFSLSLRGL